MRPLYQAAYGMQSFTPAVAGLLAPDHCQQGPPQNAHTHAHTPDQIPWWEKVFKILSSNQSFVFRGGKKAVWKQLKKRGKGRAKTKIYLKKQGREQISLDPLGKEQPNQPRTDPTQLLKSSFYSSAACSDVYLERQAEPATCSWAKAKYSNRSSANTRKQCATQNNQAEENTKNKTLGFSYMAKKKYF